MGIAHLNRSVDRAADEATQSRSPRRRRRDQRGVAIVELALVLPIVATLVFGSIDLGRMARYQNRLSNAAREAGAIVSVFPTSIDSGCRGDRNATDRAAADSNANTLPGYSVTVSLKGAGGALTPYTGCSGTVTLANQASCGQPVCAGDHLVVTVKADASLYGPYTFAMGRTVHLKRSTEVVVQG